MVLELFQIDALSAKANALGLQQKTLLQGGFPGKRDAAAGAQNALPRQSRDLLQHPSDMAGAARVARSPGNRSVGTDATAWDLADGLADRRHQRRFRRAGGFHRRGYDIIFGMASSLRHPHHRFSDRVEDYVKYRPHYSHDVVHALQQACGLAPPHLIADVGCGTGLLAEIFLENGNRVIGVEPNREMRLAGEQYLADYENFSMVEGSAEATTLDAASADFVIAGQAFHWFKPPEARVEFARILKPGGWAVLVWHDRDTQSTPFLRAYESFVRQYSTDYEQVTHKYLASYEALQHFFAPDEVKLITQHNRQRLDFDGLRGRLLSSSYIPKSGERHDAMMQALPEFFSAHAVEDRVTLEYDTKIYYGHLHR